MNINRNVLQIVAGALLVAALPVGAQVLGGNVGGAMSGALGGGLGQGIHGEGGIMGSGSITAPDGSAAAGKVRDGAQQAGQRGKDAATKTKDTTASTADATRSRVERTRGAANGAATSTAGPHGGLLFSGAGSATARKQVMGRDVSANSGATSTSSANRNGISHSTSGQANTSAKKSGPAPADTETAQ